ncbi:hypothetical protein [Novosphingobium sp. RL4]|uniref:hypothetical protein n=1 Tax=Novosphingobium sp. RL4 TaxID=3109595 RepID=UPI002D796F19|nr:hypothetical protein [Novosphingobium sp. RL4]WRT91335.1 hypothetical protein U9J33_08825 [Novosphingobium sp. RL4]
MSRARILPPVVDMLTHEQGMKPCLVSTSTAFHTVALNSGNFAAIVLNDPGAPIGAVAFLDREEVEAHITLLRNAIDDAERLDRGQSPIHASPSIVRQ